MEHKKLFKNFLKIIKKKKIKICIAESLTGGRIAYEIVKNEGASKILDYSIVCYSINSKNNILGLDTKIVKNEVVSEKVVKLMAEKVIKYSDANNILGLSCTGQAGPSILNKKEKLGTIFLGVNYKGNIFSIKKVFVKMDRKSIILKTVYEMINFAFEIIQK
jgi:nicotinamide-nucleotide amidase